MPFIHSLIKEILSLIAPMNIGTICSDKVGCRIQGVHYIGMGVSGAYQYARRGRSMSPGGYNKVIDLVLPFLKKVAARDTARDKKGRPCIGMVGQGGSGHYVKMIYNWYITWHDECHKRSLGDHGCPYEHEIWCNWENFREMVFQGGTGELFFLRSRSII